MALVDLEIKAQKIYELQKQIDELLDDIFEEDKSYGDSVCKILESGGYDE